MSFVFLGDQSCISRVPGDFWWLVLACLTLHMRRGAAVSHCLYRKPQSNARSKEDFAFCVPTFLGRLKLLNQLNTAALGLSTCKTCASETRWHYKKNPCLTQAACFCPSQFNRALSGITEHGCNSPL